MDEQTGRVCAHMHTQTRTQKLPNDSQTTDTLGRNSTGPDSSSLSRHQKIRTPCSSATRWATGVRSPLQVPSLGRCKSALRPHMRTVADSWHAAKQTQSAATKRGTRTRKIFKRSSPCRPCTTGRSEGVAHRKRPNNRRPYGHSREGKRSIAFNSANASNCWPPLRQPLLA